MTQAGTLYVVATPIGNLEDITFRAVRTLKEVDLIAAEDTRHTRKLLDHYDINTPLTSYHEHNERAKTTQLIERLADGDDIALVTDAGTPGISDPGYPLIRAAIDAEVTVVPIPGASAFVAAISVAGLPVHEFTFAGFCSPKSGRRRTKIGSFKEVGGTLMFYESPHRAVKFLNDALDVLGDRQAAVARELTKLHEEVRRGTLSQLAAHYEAHPPRGELCILIGSESRMAGESE